MSVGNEFAVSIDDIRDAHRRIAPHVVRTPLLHNEPLSKTLQCWFGLKCENLQHIGAFKARGACNAILSLSDKVAARGVVTHSSGNHAAAVARAASIRNIPAHIVMPHNTRPNKIAAVRSFGVEPEFCEPDALARQQAAERIQARTGATLIHPYNYPDVIAGQGTVALEILEQCPNVETVVVPVGGGGLLAGTLIAIKAIRPEVEVIAAEPAWADDTARSLVSGQIEAPTRYDTIADGLRTPLGDLTFPVIRALLDDLLLVDEAAIEQATATLARQAKLIAEPSGAVTLAALTQHPNRFRGRSVVAIVSGGNV